MTGASPHTLADFPFKIEHLKRHAVSVLGGSETTIVNEMCSLISR